MTKRKVEVPQRARDCKTLAEKVAFSMMVGEEWQKMRENPIVRAKRYSFGDR